MELLVALYFFNFAKTNYDAVRSKAPCRAEPQKKNVKSNNSVVRHLPAYFTTCIVICPDHGNENQVFSLQVFVGVAWLVANMVPTEYRGGAPSIYLVSEDPRNVRSSTGLPNPTIFIFAHFANECNPINNINALGWQNSVMLRHENNFPTAFASGAPLLK